MEGLLPRMIEGLQRQKRWVGEGGPGGRALIVITLALQWDREGEDERIVGTANAK